ncbi:MAG: GTPase [Verrucomicrobia bacterium]|nr:GTPase [Verrucomicrobiota bacterium]
MELSQQQALLSLALHAAYADGEASLSERESIQQLARRFEQQGVALPSPDAAVRARTVEELARQLRGPETSQIAYEMASSVCEADKEHSAPERRFLAELRTALGLEEAVSGSVDSQTHVLAEAHAIPARLTPVQSVPPPVFDVTSTTVQGSSAAELDKTILTNAILAGALELLPSTLATMAIIPVQMRLVYRIGQTYGYELDSGHVKDLLATAGVGLTSQVVEGFVERLARGFFGKVAGGLGRSLGGQVASSGMSFATTYALGQMARQYYAGGRKFSSVELRNLFDSLLGQGRQLQTEYLPRIREQAAKLDLKSLPALLRN